MFYSKDGYVYNENFLEMYFPLEYFENNYYAQNLGNKINIFGVFPIQEFIDDKPQGIKTFNIPTFVDIRTYDTVKDTIESNGKSIPVLRSSYIKDSLLFTKSIPQSVEIAEKMLSLIIDGKLPSIIPYPEIINILWKNLEIAGVNFKVPSTIYEALIMTMCRNSHNLKERFGIYYGKNLSSLPNEYTQVNTRNAVASLSTFAGIVFEDMDKMIGNGIVNSIENIEEPVSPLEQILHY